MPDYKEIFDTQSNEYDLLVSSEDFQNNLRDHILNYLGNTEDKILADLGTGTGRIARIFAPYFKHVYAFDASEHMLEKAKNVSVEQGIENITYARGDHRNIPLDANSVDVVMEGWSFCCIKAWNEENWKEEIRYAFREVERIIKPGGRSILIETMGTMTDEADPPSKMIPLYDYYENEEKHSLDVVRTDYKFGTLDEAAHLCGFFFGDDIAKAIRKKDTAIVPEYTGIWKKEWSSQ